MKFDEIKFRASKVKILPLTIGACIILMGLKLVQVGDTLLTDPESEITVAEDKPALPKKLTLAKKEKKAAEEVSELDSAVTASGAPAKKEGEEKDGGHGDAKAEKKTQDTIYVHQEKPEEKLPQFNDSEKVILEKLAARRAELDAWQKDLEMKEQLIGASSKKLDGKLEELKNLKAETEKLLAQYNEKENAKIKSLVKMYEAMKPASAASIFEEMDMAILLEIVDKMAEKKASPVLAKMSPAKAKEVTEELARQRSFAATTSEKANKTQ